MNESEKIAILEEIMELDEGSLSKTDRLEDYEEWDSNTILSLISVMGEKFNKTVSGKELMKLETVEDIMLLMEKE